MFSVAVYQLIWLSIWFIDLLTMVPTSSDVNKTFFYTRTLFFFNTNLLIFRDQGEDFIYHSRGALRPRPLPQGLHHCLYDWSTYEEVTCFFGCSVIVRVHGVVRAVTRRLTGSASRQSLSQCLMLWLPLLCQLMLQPPALLAKRHQSKLVFLCVKVICIPTWASIIKSVWVTFFLG